MTTRDPQNLALTGADATSLEHYGRALHQFQCYIEDPVASVDAALARSRTSSWPTCSRPTCTCSAPSREALPVARQPGRRTPLRRQCARTRPHRRRSPPWSKDAGTRLAACSRTCSIEHPRDMVALQIRPPGRLLYRQLAHAARSHRPRAAGLVSATCPAITPCSACTPSAWRRPATMRSAERQGRRGVELEPRDGWAQHAVAHVMEMQSRQQDGIAWMRAQPGRVVEGQLLPGSPLVASGALSPGSGRDRRGAEAVRWPDPWRALQRRARPDRCLGPAVAPASARHRRRHALAERRGRLDAGCAGAGNYAFNDVHAVMAFIGAGLNELVEAVTRVAARGDGRQRRQRGVHARGRPPGDARHCRPSAGATMREPCAACARCARSLTASAAATRSATCST